MAKISMFQQFKQLCEKLGRVELVGGRTYHETKQGATEFQQAKALMVQKFKKTKYGPWVTKPVEEEMFT